MMNKFLLVMFFGLAAVSVNAQQKLTDEVIGKRLLTPYDNYYAADREMIYTQFNKSRYITGDDIWFTSWVLNQLNKRLSFSTTKLYVELWSAEKKLISQKILYVKAGTASNFIHIEDTLAPGTYCFRAYTSWMRNFYDEKEFNSQIIILAPTVKSLNSTSSALRIKNEAALKLKEKNKPLIIPDYDIQFLPESGHFIEGIDNKIGVKVTDPSGRGVLVKGKVVDQTNKEMAIFTTNQLGMTNFAILNATRQPLRSIIELPDGKTREVKLPTPESQGVGITINAYRPETVLISLQVNKETMALDHTYILMIHANGAMYNLYRIAFTSLKPLQFKINKKDLGNGVIYATLFNEEFTPVTERIFYNQNAILKGKISLTAQTLENDTIKLTVASADSLSKVQIAKLSFSVLPEGTMMNNFSSSLLAESQLRSALKGDIETPGYYFEKNDPEHALALDNLLMIQGWRKYDWPEITKSIPKKFTYPSEVAFTINGTIKNWLKNKPELKSRISLLSLKNNLVLSQVVDNMGQFHFSELYLKDSSNIIASASSINGANWNRVLQMSVSDASLPAPEFSQINSIQVKQPEIIEEIPNMTKGVIQLEEVVVTAQKKDPFANDFNIGIMSRQFLLTKDNYMQYKDLEDVLLVNFNITVQMDNNGRTGFNMGRGNLTSIQRPMMTIDGVRIEEVNDLLAYPLNMVEAVAVDKSGLRAGSEGGNGVIAITSRKMPLFEMKADASNLQRLYVKGYSPPKEYFDPRYLIQPENPDFAKYATIYWKSELVTDTTGVASFKFLVPRPLKSVVIRAEGINFYGLFFLHEEKIVLPGR